ncbi:type II secretion system protein [Candidatus Kaiserbacteria bacterium]|nr:MAG: type II secretion system protein [Candidatus Kaiserbacteria bacterium]
MKYYASQRGFTLLEAVVLLGVFVLIVGAIVSSLRYVYRGQRFAFEQADATRSARTGIERAVQDLREASDADNGAYPIVSMATSSVSFYSDYDNDNKIEQIRYFIDGTDFKKGIIESSGDPPVYNGGSEVVTTIATEVRNNVIGTPMFTYYDKSGVFMNDYTDIDQLAFVTLRLVVNLHPERAPDDFELRSSAALRNIR